MEINIKTDSLKANVSGYEAIDPTQKKCAHS